MDGPKAQVVGEARDEAVGGRGDRSGDRSGDNAADRAADRAGDASSPGEAARRPRTWADLLILLAGAAVALAAVTPVVVRWLGNPPDQRLVDLEVYRDGGRAVLRGAPLYEVLTQPPQLLPFTYPPFAAVLAVPFTLLPWRAAQIVWTALVYAALVVTVCYAFRDLIRRFGRWAPLAAGVLVAAMTWLEPVRDQFRFGQVGLFLLAMCLADCCARTPRWPRGMLVGLAVAIKLVPGVFLVWFLITGRREALGNAVLTAAAATLAGFALLPSDSSDYWFGALLQGGDRTGAVDGTTNQAVHGIVARIVDEGPARTLLWIALAAIVAYYGFLWARRASLLAGAGSGADSRSLLLGSVAIVGLLSVVLSPVGWIHHLVWMIVVVAALAGDGRDTRRCLLALAFWAPFLFPIPWWARAMIGPEHSPASVFTGEALRDTFGVLALAAIAVLGVWLANRVESKSDLEDPSRREVGVGTLAP